MYPAFRKITNPTGPTDNSDGTLPDGTTSEDRIFGEASIDLSAIFDPNKCESFGSAMLKSRSGPPFDAAMKDFIAPNRNINIQNSGKVIIRKQTDPDEAGNTTSFGFTKTFNTDPTSANTFDLTDDGVKTFGGVIFGTGKTVTEAVLPSGWQLKSVDCSASNLGSDPDPIANGATVTFAIDAATDVLDCTYTNEKPEGALLIKKQSTKGTNPLVSEVPGQPGATFTYDDNDPATPAKDVTDNSAADGDSTYGEVCVSGLKPGVGANAYTVDEKTPPTGYGDSTDAADATVDVVAGTNCTTNQPTGTGVATFKNPPLADIQMNFRDGGSGETDTTEAITCTNASGTGSNTAATGWDRSRTVEDVKIDAAVVTITCTVKIDP